MDDGGAQPMKSLREIAAEFQAMRESQAGSIVETSAEFQAMFEEIRRTANAAPGQLVESLKRLEESDKYRTACPLDDCESWGGYWTCRKFDDPRCLERVEAEMEIHRLGMDREWRTRIGPAHPPATVTGSKSQPNQTTATA